MAFFFLFTGLLVGASIVSLSESERDYYYTNRNLNMSYLGQKDGLDVYRDNMTGQFYVDDGWDVSRIGTPGFTPHPIDRERLKQLCQKYNPQNLSWVDFLLASFEGQEDKLWKNFFEKYELGPKPKEPTWGKGIRKSRWAEYGKEVDAWEARKNELLPKFQEECRQWDEKRRLYEEQYSQDVSRNAGKVLLQRALSSGGGMIATPVATNNMKYRAIVPQGLKPGDSFLVNAGGQTMAIVVPPGAFPGQEISFQVPFATAQAAPLAQATPYTAEQPPVRPPKPAEYSAPPAQSNSYAMPPPPAIVAPPSATAPPPPPQNLQPASSMRW